ncbi:uncharacterized protein IL334_002255 [Kwoniella shivajii]|uniref:BTB domain-containing protein n=1 Tax=Kwoniella shivajii TaxID=564305 RepID=A0ABZ1CVC9_9TREE|nr:hypothetical protein IL334_002255 [Kwoniella shivajii]
MALSSYTDKSGKSYNYHEIFKSASNNFIILSPDNVAFRVDPIKLQASSSVFRDMCLVCNPESNDHLNIGSESRALYLYLSAVHDGSVKLEADQWDISKEAISLCREFDTPKAALRMLKAIRPISLFSAQHAYELFELAAEYEDVLTAFKIIYSLASSAATEDLKM